jgi:replication fork protection complex subunit Tof1/Swi1
MGEANLVKGDLLEILAKISPRVMEDKWRHKIAVAACMCLNTRNVDSADLC